jgi:5-methylcytosine-specific restriction enzyme subunit McrC
MLVLGEHYNCKYNGTEILSEEFRAVLNTQDYSKTLTRKKEEQLCFSLRYNKDLEDYKIDTSYMIGVDWIVNKELSIYVQPKLNTEVTQIDYLGMLFEALQEPENFKHLNNLYTIDFKAPLIPINQQQDMLTPFLFVEFLQVMKQIVRKGLKKSYYKVTKNLNSRVKGKVLINATIKQNHSHQKMLHNVCTFEEFGYNSIENRILKKALLITQSAVNNLNGCNTVDLKHVFNYVKPAFDNVDQNIDIRLVKNTKPNPLFKEYTHAIKLAKIILKRYNYTISKTSEQQFKTPPFWIDMTKLFELYVYKKLREICPLKDEVKYHITINRQEPDFILNKQELKMVIDAKYKPRYRYNGLSMDDARQISGYARMKKMYDELNVSDYSKVLECLVIYPDQKNGIELDKENLRKYPFEKYVMFYKYGIKLPELT